MLLKINGTPMQDIADGASNTAEHLYSVATVPVNVDIAFGDHHLVSADLNPINAPHHIVDGINHVFQAITNLF